MSPSSKEQTYNLFEAKMAGKTESGFCFSSAQGVQVNVRVACKHGEGKLFVIATEREALERAN